MAFRTADARRRAMPATCLDWRLKKDVFQSALRSMRETALCLSAAESHHRLRDGRGGQSRRDAAGMRAVAV